MPFLNPMMPLIISASWMTEKAVSEENTLRVFISTAKEMAVSPSSSALAAIWSRPSSGPISPVRIW